MCDLCKNTIARTPAHITSRIHVKKLIALFKNIKQKKILHELSEYYV